MKNFIKKIFNKSNFTGPADLCLSRSASVEKRIEVLKILQAKAESKVLNADKYRQTNLNYALIFFTGLFAISLKIDSKVFSIVFSSFQVVIMFVFMLWDRRWHETKHGWDKTSKKCYENIVKLINNKGQTIKFKAYEWELARDEQAEWDSYQPLFFYALILGSIISLIFFIVRCPSSTL